MALLANGRRRWRSCPRRTSAQAFEDTVPGRHVAEAAIVVDARDLRAVAGQDLRPASLGIGRPGFHIDIDQRAFADELLQVRQLAFFQQRLDMVSMGTIPTEQDGVLGHRRLGALLSPSGQNEQSQHEQEQTRTTHGYLSLDSEPRNTNGERH